MESQVKIRRLPETDLARIAPLTREEKRYELEQVRFFRPPLSYVPFRDRFHDIFNVQFDLLPSVLATSWKKIRSEIVESSKSEEEALANLRVARGLYGYCAKHQLVCRQRNFLPMTLGTGLKVELWHHLIVIRDGVLVVPFIDPRRSKGLNKLGRQFALSLMSHRIRDTDPDLYEARMGIFRFHPKNEKLYVPKLYTDEDIDIFDANYVDEMIDETYQIWQNVLEDRAEEARRAGGDSGPLI